MPDALITGAAGFVGRHLLSRLLREGMSVRATRWTQEPAASLPERVDCVPVDIASSAADWKKILSGVDTVFHLAARVHVLKDGENNPLNLYRQVNVAGTTRLAREAAATGVKRLIFLSSVKVHGEETQAPYQETSRFAPADPYGISKQEGEEALRAISRETGLDVVILRPPLVYGPGVKANFLQLLSVINRGCPLPFSSIKNMRSIIYVKNLVDSLFICGTDPRAKEKTYLVSDGDDVSTPGLIRQLAAALEKPARLFPCPVLLLTLAGRFTGKSSSIARLVGSLQVNICKISNELSWRPPHSREEGFRETSRWYRNQNPDLGLF